MSIPTFNAVGFCAHYSIQGNWAFKAALEISKSQNIQLNVFYFLDDPFNPDDMRTKKLSPSELKQLEIDEEKKLRLYYDDLAGEYLNVGFRVCYNDSWTELHRCLLIREFQLLVLGYTKKGAFFAQKPIEEFANNFISPVILVGPDKPDQLFFNSRAALLAPILGLDKERRENAEIANI